MLELSLSGSVRGVLSNERPYRDPRSKAELLRPFDHLVRDNTALYGSSLREKVIDVSRRLGKSALSFQVHAGRGDTITLGIENCDLIMVVAFVVKYELVPVMAMCAGCHRGNCIL